jgi:hypothetical protein
MDNFGYGRCCQCDEEYVFQDGASCARCLGLGDPSIDEGAEEESSNSPSDPAAAA